jgi:hypothetical protein
MLAELITVTFILLFYKKYKTKKEKHPTFRQYIQNFMTYYKNLRTDD